MAKPSIETCDRLLIVEGQDDLFAFVQILERLGNDARVFVKEMGGKGNMKRAALETVLRPDRVRQMRSIGVIADADASGSDTARSLSASLSEITGRSITAGEWTAGSPRVGLFVVPDATGFGELETLLWQSWSSDPQNAAARACIDGYLDCMRTAGHAAHSPDKGRIGALLAVRNDEDPRVGPGLRRNVFNLESAVLAPLVAFLRAL
jgi:5S rRNA maturation endonuclease (ribonuclease M5)